MNNSTAIQIISALVVRSPFDAEILPAWQQQGHAVEVKWTPTTVIMDNIRDGYRSDIAIVTVGAMDELIAAGIVDGSSRIELVESRIGLAVKAGEPHPDIATTEALVATLLAARSVAYSIGGASGIYFNAMIEKLGIAEAVNARASTIPEGFTAEKLISGEASLAVQQVSELLVVPGIEVIGRLPEAVQKTTAFSAALFKTASQPELCRDFLRHLQSAEASRAYQAKGLDPVFNS